MKVSIVTGLGYGDEGKGTVTKWLSLSSPKPLVIRYGGGNQVGHTVMEGDLLHVHHHTGSGTTSNIETFYSRFCTVEPIGTYEEIVKLLKLGFYKMQYYDPRAMLVTPLDVYRNRKDNEGKHSSVGVGFGRTIQRNEDHYKLYVHDILHKGIFYSKCEAIQDYYGETFDIDTYYICCLEFLSICTIKKLSQITTKYETLIFEGHQGVLIDMEYGTFPYVTRSKTTVKNAYTILNEEEITPSVIENFMVTRAYHTRHGDGPFRKRKIKLKNNEYESNKTHEHQGDFKIAKLDFKLLQFSIDCNFYDRLPTGNVNTKENIVITCLDQVENPLDIVSRINGLSRGKVFVNDSPRSTTIRPYLNNMKL